MVNRGLQEAIRAVGGVTELARRVGISQPSVSNWTRIPAGRVVAVEAATGIDRSILRPDLYGTAGDAASKHGDATAEDAAEWADKSTMRIIGLAGWSGSGKTTLITKLVPVLKLRGLRVSTLKHAHHGFDLDRPGKDSFRHREAGATDAADGMEQAISTIKLVVDGELARMRLARLRASRGASADVSEVVERLANVIEHTEKGETLALGIDIAPGLHLPFGPEQLSEIMGALMENAARHAIRQIRVSARRAENGVRMTVEDDGPGMPPERLQALQADAGEPLDRSGYTGGGLGLLIARDLVRSSGGALSFGTSPLGGLQVSMYWHMA